MKTVALLALAAAFGALPGVAAAGPCTQQIADVQAQFDSRETAVAATGPAATESTAAKLHHQPTASSIANAEERVGDLPPEQVKAFQAAIARARTADAAGDAAACRTALHDSQAALAH